MAYESSEIMFAAALLCKPKPEDYANTENLKRFMIKAKKKVETSPQLVQFGNKAIENGFISLMDEGSSKMLADMAGGISAAIAVRRYMGINQSTNVVSYMTGNIWPKEVEKFKVSAFGFQDYNSADVIVTADKKTYYGISLKKKRKSQDASPTLINKAFDSLLVGREFDDTKKKLVEARVNYFADIVIEAVSKNIILKKDIKNFDSLVISNKKELFEAKNRDRGQFDRSYIDTKGYGTAPDGYQSRNTNDSKSMRFFVNSKLAERDNELWKAFLKVLNDNVELFSDSLLNIILKVKLFEKMDSKDLGKFKFDFALVTGVGNVRGDKVDVGRSEVIGLSTTLCGLTRLEEQNRNQGYRIIVDDVKSASSKGAKVFLQLVRGSLTLLDLEIRYKGSFTPQPQFQATLNKRFVEFLKRECDL